MALGTTATIITAGLIGAGAAGAVSMASGNGFLGLGGAAKKVSNTPAPLPQPPSPEATAEKGQEMARRRKATATQTVYTSPLGIDGEAALARSSLQAGKTKLGE